MRTFYYDVKKANGKAVPCIADLIPVGMENAISRSDLLRQCEQMGICESDRVMRHLIEKARIDYVILSREGGGYYRPTLEDSLDLARYIKQETARAKSVFRSLKRAKKLYADYQRGLDVNG